MGSPTSSPTSNGVPCPSPCPVVVSPSLRHLLLESRRRNRILPAAKQQGRAVDGRKVGPAVRAAQDRLLLTQKCLAADPISHGRQYGGQPPIAELIKLSGGMSIPVIVVGDQVVRGFNKPQLKTLLGI